MISAPSFDFKPLDQHIDGGFGATANAFIEAANVLGKEITVSNFLHSSIPISFLFRHAIELYLKSLIVVVHVVLDLPSMGGSSSKSPTIRQGEHWIPIYRIHSVAILHAYFRELMDNNMTRLLEMSDTDWRTIPADLPTLITAIEDIDERGTYFRYPGGDDSTKSDFKELSVEDVMESIKAESSRVKVFLETGETEHVVSTFRYDPSKLNNILKILREAANQLSILHFAFRCDLAQGR